MNAQPLNVVIERGSGGSWGESHTMHPSNYVNQNNGGGTGGGDPAGITAVNTLTGLSTDPSSWDTEIDFSDGTSMLGMEFGGGVIGVLELDGTYTGYSILDLTKPQITFCLLTNQRPDESCFLPPKWMCPYGAGGWGLAAKWTTIALMRGKSSPIADGIGLTVGAAMLQYCNSLTS